MALARRLGRGWSGPALAIALAAMPLVGGGLASNAAGSSSTGPSATGSPATSEPRATAEARRALPGDLEPSLDQAPVIRPRAYRDGCHAKAGDTRAHVCTYGQEDASFSVLLMGDSHAVQWLPALEDLAAQEGWRLYSLTKSACPVPRTPVIVRGKRLRDCEAWREDAFERIAELRPDIVLAASLGRIYRVPGARTAERRERAWRRAWTRSLEVLRESAGRVLLLGDTPMWANDPLRCLRRHRRDIGRCDTPRADALSASTEASEREAAARAGVAYVPTADLVCPGDPCHAVEGRYLVLGDVQHMTVAWARHIAPELLRRLTCDPAPGPSASPAAASSPGPHPSAATSGPTPASMPPGPAATGSTAPGPVASSPPVPGSARPSPAPGMPLSCPR